MTMTPDDDRQYGQGMRRRKGGRSSIYGGGIVYPVGASLNGGVAVRCPSFEPANGDPGTCANCGAYDGDHHATAMAGYDLSDWSQGIPGSDASTGAY